MRKFPSLLPAKRRGDRVFSYRVPPIRNLQVVTLSYTHSMDFLFRFFFASIHSSLQVLSSSRKPRQTDVGTGM